MSESQTLPVTCQECDRLNWPTKQPLHGVDGRSLCWTHAREYLRPATNPLPQNEIRKKQRTIKEDMEFADRLLETAKQLEEKELAKPHLPWRKVSEEPLPRDGKQFIALRIDVDGLPDYAELSFWSKEWMNFIPINVKMTHWCYLDELKPEGGE